MSISRYLDEDGRRHYETEDGKDFLSVTTILDELEKPSELTAWQERNNGEDGNANHEHLLWYKSNRGTLLHHEVLSMFEAAHDAPELFSEDEAESEQELFNGHSPNKVYSVLKDKGLIESEENMDEETNMEEIYEEDRKIFKQIFNVIAVREKISMDSIKEVEKMFVAEPEEGLGYGGQIDLIYEKNGETIVADLKTSSGVRDKHLLQAAAYARSLEEENVKAQVIRIHPDSGDWGVKEMSEDELEEKWLKFKEIAEEAYND